MATFPEEWNPTKVDVKSGWKNRSKVLADITTYVNDETYIPDENDFMEKVDLILEYLKLKYKIQNK